MEKIIKGRIDFIGTAPSNDGDVNFDNIKIDKIQTIRIYDKSNSKKKVTWKEKDIRQYLHLGKVKGKNR